MTTTTHPMADKPIGQLSRQFAVPSIIAMLVTSLYNIIDQLFIGQSIGLLGNAATNIAFPLTHLRKGRQLDKLARRCRPF